LNFELPAAKSPAVHIEIINTGAELMLGRVLNTHQQWLCRQLADAGCVVTRQVAVDDSAAAIHQAVRSALMTADIIITTGGLGPTSDDRTRDLIAALLERKLREDATVLARIEKFFAERHRRMPAGTRVQALVPDGATVLQNEHGTAPGLVMEVNAMSFQNEDKTILLVMLPGPPRELHPMFAAQALPIIRARLPRGDTFACRTLKTTGLGESIIEEKIAGPLRSLTDAGLELGYCARVGEVDVRFVARGAEVEESVAAAERIVREKIGEYVFGVDDDQMEAIVVRLLTARNQTLALAESCTGGFIANRLTNIPGASAVFLAGLVTYSNEAKHQFLGVLPATLAEHGAVSDPIAREMAEGARRQTGADFALSVTGIAGPSGGSDAKPVGTVFIGLATAEKTVVRRQLNRYDRETFKYLTSQQALDLLRRALLEK
jgi:nicotinamide-nucleotide amidase